MNQEEDNENFRFLTLISLLLEVDSCPPIQEYLHPYQLVLPLTLPMADNTCSHTLSRLEEAVTLLTQKNSACNR